MRFADRLICRHPPLEKKPDDLALWANPEKISIVPRGLPEPF